MDNSKYFSDLQLDVLPGDKLIIHFVCPDNISHPSHSGFLTCFVKKFDNPKIYSFVNSHPDRKQDVKFLFDMLFSYLNKVGSQKWCLDKKKILHLTNGKLNCINDVNLLLMLNDNSLLTIDDFYTPTHLHFYSKHRLINDINCIVPLEKHHEMFHELSESIIRVVKLYKIDVGFFATNQTYIETLWEVERNGLFVDAKRFGGKFADATVKNNFVYTDYNIYNPSGRLTNSFQSVNYSALNKDDGTRDMFISRHGKDGKLVMIDYAAFYPRIICQLIDYDMPYDMDVYQYLGQYYFDKPVDMLTPSEVAAAKTFTFKQLFGGIENRYKHIEYFRRLDVFIEELWGSFIKDGEITSPYFNRRITEKHIQQPYPNKLFNYFLQTAEAEIGVMVMKKLNELLNSKKSKLVLYVYDALVFDVHVTEASVLKTIYDTVQLSKSFPVKIFAGDTYGQLQKIVV